jgi:precorrin-3B methylase
VWNNHIDDYGFSRRNYNSFLPLLNYNIICYNCNNYGHIAKLCRSVFRKYKEEETPIVMERNQEQREHKKEKSLFIQVALQAQNNIISGTLIVGAQVT